MSELQKKIARIQRRESGPMGFGVAAREQPRAMLLGLLADGAAGVKAAIEAGADVVIVEGAKAAGIAEELGKADGKRLCAGARLDSLDLQGAAALQKAGCDFAISTLEGTLAAAVDTDKMGQVLAVPLDIDDTTLRALGPLGLDALFVTLDSGEMTMADQLTLVRLASFAGCPLLVTIGKDVTVDQLRVLRDSGTAMVVASAGTTADEATKLIDALKATPAPKRRQRNGHEIALVPSMAGHDHEEEDDDGGEDE
jgi:hypothetical protein